MRGTRRCRSFRLQWSQPGRAAAGTCAAACGRHMRARRRRWAAGPRRPPRRRSHLDHRLVVVAGSRKELARKLTAFARGEAVGGCIARRAASRQLLAFVFTGQGAQWWAMGRGLLAQYAVFRDAVAACDPLVM